MDIKYIVTCKRGNALCCNLDDIAKFIESIPNYQEIAFYISEYKPISNAKLDYIISLVSHEKMGNYESYK